MVGVAGKSRGCITCRRRKIKCSEEKPQCQRCASSGRDCEGYSRFPVFIIRTPEGLIKRKPLEEVRPAANISRICSSQTTPSTQPLDLTTSSPTPAGYLALPESLNLASFFLQTAESNFLETWVPSPFGYRDGNSSWIVTATSKGTRSNALEASFKALTLSRFSQTLNEPSLAQQARAAYGVALVEVQKALYDKRQMFDDDTLAAGRVCALYELFEATSNSSNSWGSHELGMAELIRLRGPARHQHGLAHEIFRGFRGSSVIHSIQHSRASILLSNPEWDDIPWREQPKDDRQKLYDMGLAVGPMFRDMKLYLETDLGQKIDVPEHHPIFKLLTCLRQLDSIGQGLESWSDHYSEHVLYDDSAGSGSSSCDSDAGFQFKNFAGASDLAMCWALQIVTAGSHILIRQGLLSVLDIVFELVDAKTGPFSRLELDDFFEKDWNPQFEVLGENIMQAARFLFRKQNGSLGAQSMIFPLRIALTMYQRSRSPRVDECQALYDQLGSKWGLGFAESINRPLSNGEHWTATPGYH